ncbi:MAG: phytase [Fimbriimonadaceae bacterium]|nr:phytase [Fimbriimonadaceae bacterium]
MTSLLLLLSPLSLSARPIDSPAPIATIRPAVVTQPVADDADDPAIWVNPRNPAHSRVIGTNKVKRPSGGLYVFDLDGKIVQRIQGLDRPNNVDVIQGVFGRRDYAVCTERLQGRLRIFEIGAGGTLTDRTGQTDVVMKGTEEYGEPMGIALWRSRRTGNVYALVSPKLGPADGYLEQYELSRDSETGRVNARFVGRTGHFRGGKEIESIATSADGISGYYSDETYGNRMLVLQDRPNGYTDARPPLNPQFRGDHEGIALWERGAQRYVVFTDQLPINSVYTVTRPNGSPIGQFSCGADETDGIAITAANLGPKFPRGLFVAMDSKRRRFVYVDWREIERTVLRR